MIWDFGPDLWDNSGTSKDGPRGALLEQRAESPGLARRLRGAPN